MKTRKSYVYVIQLIIGSTSVMFSLLSWLGLLTGEVSSKKLFVNLLLYVGSTIISISIRGLYRNYQVKNNPIFKRKAKQAEKEYYDENATKIRNEAKQQMFFLGVL